MMIHPFILESEGIRHHPVAPQVEKNTRLIETHTSGETWAMKEGNQTICADTHMQSTQGTMTVREDREWFHLHPDSTSMKDVREKDKSPMTTTTKDTEQVSTIPGHPHLIHLLSMRDKGKKCAQE